jgi:putative Mg2+ transporter-C (MgtC) family protein
VLFANAANRRLEAVVTFIRSDSTLRTRLRIVEYLSASHLNCRRSSRAVSLAASPRTIRCLRLGPFDSIYIQHTPRTASLCLKTQALADIHGCNNRRRLCASYDTKRQVEEINGFEFHGWDLLKLALAYLLVLPIGWEREEAERSAGLRTFPLMSIASCAYVLVAIRFMGAEATASARIIQGLIGAVGFLGAGAVITRANGVHGTATAASIFGTGAIGAAVAFGYWDVAVVLSLLNLVTLHFLAPLKRVPKASRKPE